ncbi:MAG: nitrate reductase [Rhodobacteraceae bacterium]|nr:MAG: nitrate reductase [Paracoccaceae bacterium]
MSATTTDHPASRAGARPRTVWRDIGSFLLLACVILPVVMFGAIAAYGFFIWFMQILFWGPPT